MMKVKENPLLPRNTRFDGFTQDAFESPFKITDR